MKRFIIHCEVFKSDHLVQFGGTLQSAVDEYCALIEEPTWTIKNDKDTIGKFFASVPCPSCGIWFSKHADLGTIVHECFHAVHYITSIKDIKLTDASEEFYAYYLNWFFDQVMYKSKWKNK